MTTKKMLIDAAHLEETRVVTLNGNRLEDFDVEVESRKQLKGNIYLAKVTRVEPSLQAAFVDYGGNRHGFLAFSEIHPDYFQIPVADREALAQAEDEAASDEDLDAEDDAAAEADDMESLDVNEDIDDAEEEETVDDAAPVQMIGGDDIEEAEDRRKTVPLHRNYKIQEVIKRRQILLIQVVKEERGNKGAALTTYISLAGRYCVLMPNTARGGGISRKISSGNDRKRLKGMLNEFGIPDGMAVIVRTAGAKHSRAEIKRDYEYLIRLWDTVRETTLESSAPTLIHEEGNLIKRSIRDLYSKDIDEIIVEGEAGYRTAKDFMKLLIPSHAKKVQPYKESGMRLFQRYQVENQLDAMHNPVVHLPSGGYIVINPTEALVSIDVNSGKATRERNIEETALKTNTEAAIEIARQLRLRDLAGLIVIDFIDMEVHRNNTKVERVVKDAMRNDRARIQLGRISPFGLLELSRQRLRPSLIETSSSPCPHCGGTGVRRSTESTAMHILRAIEEEGTRRRADEIVVRVASKVALFILNQKREALAEIEQRHHFRVLLEGDDSLIPPDHVIERTAPYTGPALTKEEEDAVAARDAELARIQEEEKEENGKRRRRRRSRGRKRNQNDRDDNLVDDDDNEAYEASENDEQDRDDNGGDDDDDGSEKGRRRRRGRRGGRRRTRRADEHPAESTDSEENPLLEGPEEPALLEAPESGPAIELPDESGEADAADEGEEQPRKRRVRTRSRRTRTRRKVDEAPADGTASDEAADTPAEAEAETKADAEMDTGAAVEEKPKRRRGRPRKVKTEEASEEAVENQPQATEETEEKPKRRRTRRKSKAEEAEQVSEAPASAPADEKPVEAAAAEPKEETDGKAYAKTTVIDVDSMKKDDGDGAKKGGWWRRLTS